MLVPEVFTPQGGKAIDEADRDQEFTYATSAQFPVPIGGEDLSNWKSLGSQLTFTHATDRQLVIVNKGRQDSDAGFDVCEKCGAAVPAGAARVGRHVRPYIVEWAKNGPPPDCDGAYRRVFLGTTFKSDLLVLRLRISEPLATNMAGSATRCAVEDALRSLAEALVLSGSRHLDIDPGEFSAGFRVIPSREAGELTADLYVYDTLSGGAGYADQLGQSLDSVIARTLQELRNCPARCDRSCYDCLRHYGNQYWHDHLDRHLAAALLDYGVTGAAPRTDDLNRQRYALGPLRRMLELDAVACESGSIVNGVAVPLCIRTGTLALFVGTYPGLLDRENAGLSHPVAQLADTVDDVRMKLVNEFVLSRNLPLAYQQIRDAMLGAPGR
jgi:hypothetical protein